jgi:predicted house-cleaning noncanonical NTP pyrophosphatase (MazG superfamily)
VHRTYYRKLIRDRIPAIIAKRGRRCALRKLGPAGYARALKDKIREEAAELAGARGISHTLNELIDLQELILAYRRVLRIRSRAFDGMLRRKRIERGGFRKRLFLEYTEEPHRHAGAKT